VNRTKWLAPRAASGLTLLLLLSSSTFAEDWTRRRTAESAIRVGDAVIRHRNGGRHHPRGRLAAVVIRELEILLRDRQRSARSGPERWPDEPGRQWPGEPRRQPPPPRRDDFSGPLVMPVAGVRWEELKDSFGDPRSGGRRHQGVDIFAPRWTEVLATTYGTLTSIGNGGRAGLSLWLVGRDGRSYFYGHLQAWARRIYEGLRVEPGELIGYVGNSGNASGSPTYLHFEVHERGRAVNPRPVLASAEPTYGTGRTARRRIAPLSRRGD